MRTNMAAGITPIGAELPIRAKLNNRRGSSKVTRWQQTACSGKSRAGEYPANVMRIIREMQKGGAKSLWTIADTLNARGVKGARGGKWYATTVRKFIERHKAAPTRS
jgi:hypothetical protein